MRLIGNRYRIKSLIGEGGMASVYSAIDEKLDRRVAVKILHSHLSNNKDIRQRFHFEAKSIADIDHPNILKVYDFSGNDSEQLWIVTEILYGVDLSEYVNKFPGNRLDPLIASMITRQICNALEEVHNHGIVHRDIKPENIMVLDTGIIKLMDFGIAKVARNQNATQTGTFMGSPSYMSPEQIKGTNVDVRTDLYSLSVLLYEIITGTLPYVGANTVDVINKIMMGKYIQALDIVPDIPQALNKIINKGLASNRDRRYPSAMSLAIHLDKLLARYDIKDSVSALKKFFKNPRGFLKKLEQAGYSLESSRKTHKYPEGKVPLAAPPPPPQSAPDRQISSPQKEPIAEASSNNQTWGEEKLASTGARKRTESQYSSHNPKNRSRSVSPSKRTRSGKSRLSTSKKDSEKILNSYLKKNSSGTAFKRIAVAVCLIAGLGFLGTKYLNDKNINQLANFTSAKVESMKGQPKAARQQKRVREARLEKNISRSDITSAKKASKDSLTRTNRSRPSNLRVTQKKIIEPPPQKELPKAKVELAAPTPKVDTVAAVIEPKAEENDLSTGRIRIKSSPASDIYINDRLHFASNDPSVRKKGIILAPGTYNITLKRRGYTDLKETVELDSNEILNLNYSLQRDLNQVMLQIQTNRIPGQLIIKDARSKGVKINRSLVSLNTSVELQPGSYQVIVQHTDKTFERFVNLENNNQEPYIVDAQFK